MKKKLIVKKTRGFISSVENPNIPKKQGTVHIAQTLSSKPSKNFVVRTKKRAIGYARTEKGAWDLALRKKKKRKAIFLD